MINEAIEVKQVVDACYGDLRVASNFLRKPISWVKRRLNLLKLHPELQQLVIEGRIKLLEAGFLSRFSYEKQFRDVEIFLKDWERIRIHKSGFRYRKTRKNATLTDTGVFVIEQSSYLYLPAIYPTGIIIYGRYEIKSVSHHINILPMHTISGREIILKISSEEGVRKINPYSRIAKI